LIEFQEASGPKPGAGGGTTTESKIEGAAPIVIRQPDDPGPKAPPLPDQTVRGENKALAVITNSIGMKMALIPAGEFLMGSPAEHDDAGPEERPQHRVEIRQSFYLSVYELTQAEYKQVMGENPSWFSAEEGGREIVAGLATDRFPVENISWLDAIAFCNRLSGREKLSPYYRLSGTEVTVLGGDGYRLPTEAEWEYACRAGSRTRYYFGDDASQLPAYAWFANNSGRKPLDATGIWLNVGGNFARYCDEIARNGGRPHAVGLKKPNRFGLYDMHGNVWEWCWDWHQPYTAKPVEHPDASNRSRFRVLRGRCWLDGLSLRTALRGASDPTLRLSRHGLRPARTEVVTNSIGMKLAWIPAGEFRMGSPDSHKDAFAWEKPQHRVRITRPFYLGVHEVTRGQFRRFVEEDGYETQAESDGKGGWHWNGVAGTSEQDPRYSWRNPGFDQSDDHPVVQVSWKDAVEFATWLSRKEGKTYRLPTEAEWEYACRAGTTTRYSSGEDPETLALVGNVADGTAAARFHWTSAISARDGFVETAPVGRCRPNRFGLFDMHGNVYEWCSDWYDPAYYKESPVDDPVGPPWGSDRVIRGGSWNSSPSYNRSANRASLSPLMPEDWVGFRLVLVPSDR
jgi:formylglycine-generating enzyme required for sulfatase activity